MKFSDIVKQASVLLKDKGQASYRMLKREFALDDEMLADLKAELIEVDRLAVDKDGQVLVWVGASPVQSSEFKVQSPPPSPPRISDAGLRTPDTGQSAAERRQLTVMCNRATIGDIDRAGGKQSVRFWSQAGGSLAITNNK